MLIKVSPENVSLFHSASLVIVHISLYRYKRKLYIISVHSKTHVVSPVCSLFLVLPTLSLRTTVFTKDKFRYSITSKVLLAVVEMTSEERIITQILFEVVCNASTLLFQYNIRENISSKISEIEYINHLFFDVNTQALGF